MASHVLIQDVMVTGDVNDHWLTPDELTTWGTGLAPC